MTPEERKRMNELCQLIADEQDHEMFTRLVKELDELLSQKERRFPLADEPK